MPDKPSYLGLLNAIAVAETRAHEYLTAWIAVTPSPEVDAVLRTVAAREGEHGMTFAKRVDELGFQVRVKDDPESAKRLEVAGSSDCGRYIAEERDSGRLLRACYEQLQAQATAGGSSAPEDSDRLDVLEGKLDAVCRAVDEVRQIVCAQSMPTATS